MSSQCYSPCLIKPQRHWIRSKRLWNTLVKLQIGTNFGLSQFFHIEDQDAPLVHHFWVPGRPSCLVCLRGFSKNHTTSWVIWRRRSHWCCRHHPRNRTRRLPT